MDWLSYHRESEIFASEAALSFQRGYFTDARRLYRMAADLEEKAVGLIDETRIRTREIIGGRVISLLFKAGEYDMAEQFAKTQNPALNLCQWVRDSYP